MGKGLLALFLIAIFFTQHANAELLPVWDLETAEVLPAGVFSPRFRTMMAGVSSTFNNDGISQPSATAFNKQVKWADVLSGQTNEAERESLRSLMNTGGRALADDGIAGSTTMEVNNVLSVAVPVLLMGVTDKFLVGVAVPVVHVDSQTDTGFVKSEEGQELVNRACAATSPVKCAEVAGRLNRAVQEKLSTLGYDPIRSQSFTAIGDVRVLAKYSLFTDGTNQLTLKPIITLPTGRTSSPNDVLALHTGDGRYQLSLSAVYDRKDILLNGLKFTAYTGALGQLPDSTELRIPTRESNLSADKEKVSRSLTSGVFAGASLLYVSRFGVALGAGYNYQYASGTTYTGKNFAADRYTRLGEINSSRTLHNATLLAGFTTVNWYKRKQFAVPLEVNFTYNRSLGGKNNWDTNSIGGELILFL